MRTKLFACAVAFVSLAHTSCLLGRSHPERKVFTCETISRARPGEGVAYKGVVTNGDYRFDVAIPSGLVGWGAGPDAPFHGFTVFLSEGSSARSCINFVIGIHVDLPEDLPTASSVGERTTTVKVGNKVGLQTVSMGTVHGVRFENLSVKVELLRDGYKNDLSITLITPTADKNRTTPILEKFISQIKLW